MSKEMFPTPRQLKLSKVQPAAEIVRREIDHFQHALDWADVGTHEQMKALRKASNVVFDLGREANTRMYEETA